MTSLVVREFREDLERIQRHYQGRRDRERRALYLLALEREQLVTVHYSGAALHERIAALAAPADVRRLIHHAMRWAARDEDMHTVYARGILCRQREIGLAIRAVGQQLGGLVAGWASAVSQHVTFGAAPVARLLSILVSFVGLVAGKVPRSARRTLSHQSFRGFAAFNREAEETAAMCWERLAELGDPDAALCRRVAHDERKHAAVFRVLVETFDDDDRLLPGVTAESLGARFAAVDPVFVPRAEEGAEVIVREDASASVTKLFGDTLIASGLLDRVVRERRPARVAIKAQLSLIHI